MGTGSYKGYNCLIFFTTAASGTAERLALEYVAQTDGFMYIYVYPSAAGRRRVANETMKDLDVYFPATPQAWDDFTITHTGICIIQSTDYFPGDLVLQEEKNEPYRFGYQGQYAEFDPETSLNHFEARQYDSRAGRWTTRDPKRAGYSPYWSMNNNPVYYVDPDGRCPDCEELVPNPFKGAFVSFGYGDNIAEYIYDGYDWLRVSGGELNEVVITPSFGQNTSEFLKAFGADFINGLIDVPQSLVGATYAGFGAMFTGSRVDSWNTRLIERIPIYENGKLDYQYGWADRGEVGVSVSRVRSKELLINTVSLSTTIITSGINVPISNAYVRNVVLEISGEVANYPIKKAIESIPEY